MKILPEHETLLSIMSKLIQLVWNTFELPTDDVNISNGGTISQDLVVNKKKSMSQDNVDVEQHNYDGIWTSIVPASESLKDLSLLWSATNIPNMCGDDFGIPPDLKSIEHMLIERDVPCRVTGVLTRGIY